MATSKQKSPSQPPKITITKRTLPSLNPSILTAYSPKNRVRISFPGPGRTRQSAKAECDINNIMSRFQKTGVFDFTTRKLPSYGDVTGVQFDSAMQLISEARAMFGDLPASVRAEFDNDPAAFLDFASDPANADALVEMGLAERSEDPSGGGSTPPSKSAVAAPGASVAPVSGAVVPPTGPQAEGGGQ